MPVFKRVLCKERLRQVPRQFSWVDHRLVRDRHISRCSAEALALYLFLVTVADGQGLSYYADATICRLLPLDAEALGPARRELIDKRLIAYQRPLYQVLALPAPPSPHAPSSPQAKASQQSQPSPRRPPIRPPASPRPKPGGPAPTRPAATTPGQESPHPLAQIFRLMALDSAPDKPLDSIQEKP